MGILMWGRCQVGLRLRKVKNATSTGGKLHYRLNPEEEELHTLFNGFSQSSHQHSLEKIQIGSSSSSSMAQRRRRQRSSGAASLRSPAEALHWSIGR